MLFRSEWLPEPQFLPPEYRRTPPWSWHHWERAAGQPFPSAGVAPPADSPDPRQALDALRAAHQVEQVYESVEALARALQVQLEGFRPWRRDGLGAKPKVSGLIMTAMGPRRITLLLDTGATHCFICAELARALPPSGILTSSRNK